MITDADYTIFVWRMSELSPSGDDTPTIYLRNPSEPLPSDSSYQNPSYYFFRPHRKAGPSHNGSRVEIPSVRSKRSVAKTDDDATPKHKKEFEKFHSENGVRTIVGSIGPVSDSMHLILVFRLLLKPFIQSECC